MGKEWLIYALGGGWGHLNRAIALGRIATHSRAVTILTNSPYVPYVQPYLQATVNRRCFPLTLHSIAAEASFEDTCDRIQQWVLRRTWQCAIIDTFPRGLGGELVDLRRQSSSFPWFLVHRDLNPDYVRAKALPDFVRQFYQAVFIPGDGAPDNRNLTNCNPSNDESIDRSTLPLANLPNVYWTAPWLLRSANELPALEKSQRPNAIVCAAGQASELAFFGCLSRQLHCALPHAIVRCLAPQCPPSCPPEIWISHWPGIEVLQMADVVIGGAGYNTVHECAALGIPLVAFAFKRLYDRQSRRAQKWGHPVQTIEQAIATTQRLLERNTRTTPFKHAYQNGAISAVSQIEQLLR